MTYRKPKLKRVCQFCGNEFPATRSDTRFCCDAHRVAYSRWAVRLTARHVAVERQLTLIAEYLAFPDANAAARSTLQSLARSISNLLEDVE